MWFRSFGLRLFIGLIGVLGASILLGEHVVKAQDTPSWNKAIPKESPKRPTKAPPARPRSAPRRPVAREETAPLLSVQYRILKINQNNTQIEVSPLTVFNAGDRVRFAVKANQDVFLYIIQQKGLEQTGRIFFPDSQINSGQNFVAKDSEFVVPSNCLSSASPAACSYEVDASTGQEYFTLIFSRSPTINLSENAAGIGSDIKPQALNQFVNTSGQKLDMPRRGDTIFSLRINNLNPKANEMIVLRYVLNKRGRALSGSTIK